MKKVYGLLTVLFLFASFSLVVAQNETNVSDESSLVVAPIPALYSDNLSNNVSIGEPVSSFKYGWEKFKLFFIRNETKRIQQELKLANWKLAEARKAAKDKDFAGAENALKAHEELLSKIGDEVNKLSESNRSLTPGLDEAISNHEERLSRLNTILQNSNLTDDQKSKIEERISKLENNTAHLNDIREKLRERRAEKISEFERRSEERIANQTERANRIESRIQNRTAERNRSEDIASGNQSED